MVYVPLGTSILIAIGIGAYCYWWGVLRHNAFSLGLTGWLILVFFFILAPTSSIVPIADIAFEHRVYLASATIVTGVCLIGSYMARRLIRKRKRQALVTTAFTCIAVSVIGLLAWRTHLRNHDYTSGLLLWQSAIDTAPENPRVWYNLGRELVARGEIDAAMRPMENAVSLSGASSVPKYDVGLAHCLAASGRVDDAIALFLRALEKTPNNARNRNDLGVVYMKAQRTDDALETLGAAAKLGYPIAMHNLGMLHKENGDIALAIESFQNALDLQPTLTSAARRLAWILATTNEAVLRDGERAVSLLENDFQIETTRSAYAWDAYGAALAEAGRFDEAVVATERAVTLAREADKPELAESAGGRLAGYKNGVPHRDDGSDQDSEQTSWRLEPNDEMPSNRSDEGVLP